MFLLERFIALMIQQRLSVKISFVNSFFRMLSFIEPSPRESDACKHKKRTKPAVLHRREFPVINFSINGIQRPPRAEKNARAFYNQPSRFESGARMNTIHSPFDLDP
jgi:hypothetical protein